MTSLQELVAQQAELQKKIDDLQRQTRADGIAKVKALMAEFGLTASDIAGAGKAPRASGDVKPSSKVAVKYRNAKTGETWTGRGTKPKWLRAALESGVKIEDFLV
jgi:DNA-binding protein H-NS